MDGNCTIAIDLGTGGPKVALFTLKGGYIDHEFEATPLQLLPNGGAEQSPEGWWAAITIALGRLLKKQPDAAKKVAAICLTSQWSGTVAIDQSGKPLMNAIIWMDSRGAPHVDKVADGLLKVEGYEARKLYKWLKLTGGAPGKSGKDSIAHILYIKNELPHIYAKTHKFLEPKDYLNFKLCGNIVTSAETTILHWVTDNRNINDIRYNDELLAMSGLERRHLPPIVKTNEIIGTLLPGLAKEWGLPENVKIVAGVPDLHSAAVGSGAVRDFEAHLYIGTSSWLTCHVPFKKTDIFHNMASLPSAIPGRYLIANEQETAGECLDFLKGNIFFPDDEMSLGAAPPDFFKTLDSMAAKVPAGSDKLIFTPWLFGERSPVEDHSIRGGFHNMSLRTTRAHLFRAVLEGVAYNSRWLLKYVEKFVGKPFGHVNMIGGGAVSSLWCQIHADVLQRPIRQLKNPMLANARGAAFLASLALGALQLHQIPDVVEIDRTYEPNPQNAKVYDLLFKEFLNIYKANKKIYGRLNR